ncbi:hypothetical protein GWA97_11005 [Flavobacterium sp. LaA7.5]|nr:hypothetical protein [Flavobacterium salilacus subsp. altitudinum]
MTTADFIIEDTNVTVYNTNLGKEIVVVNGKSVSEKYSVFGTRHEFIFENDTYEVLTSFLFWNVIGIKIQLRKNGKLVGEKTEGQSMIVMVVGIFIIVLILHFLFGII